MKSHVTAVPRLTSGKLVVFSKQDSQNTKKKLKKLVPKISPGLKEKHLHQRLTNRLSLSMSRQTTTSSIGTKPRSLTKKQTKPLAGSKKPYGFRSRGKDSMNKDEGAYKLDRIIWPDYLQTATFGVDDVITVIKGCHPVTHLHAESSEQGSWQELKYFEWVLLFILDLYNRTILGYIDFEQSWWILYK